MHPFPIPKRCCLALLTLIGVSGSATAQVAAPDSLLPPPAQGLPDSLAGVAADSLGAAPADSLFAGMPDSVLGAREEAAEWLDPWSPAPPQVAAPVLDWTRPEDFEDALDWVDGTSVRVAGEKGMATFADTAPYDVAPELYVDGLPSRSPADLDPALFDRASVMVTRIHTTRMRPAWSWGSAATMASLDDPLSGRTVLHGYFTRSAHETYTRAVGLRTPGTERMLRLDFQEFKTEDGYDYSASPDVLLEQERRGRAKQRRFRFSGRTRSGVGELSFEFGRGRRYARGDAIRPDAIERWTGRLAVGLDRGDSSGTWHVRLYQLDFRDDFKGVGGNSRHSRDAARAGLRAERVAEDGGFFGGLMLERQSARFLPPSFADADTTLYTSWAGEAGLGWRADPDGAWRPWASVHVSASGHTDQTAALGGRAGLGRDLGFAVLQAEADRIPRTPTLMETYGVTSQRLVTPTASGAPAYDPALANWVFRPGGEMDFEVQDRLSIGIFDDTGALRWRVGYSNWWLRKGIGWVPVADGEARFISGIEGDVDMIEASVQATATLGSVRVRALARGHVLPGRLEQRAGRPGGWPRAAWRARVGLDRHFFSPRNRIGVDAEADYLGEHFDDLTGPIGGVVGETLVLGTRGWLRIRDAEIFMAVDNVLDERREEVLGTWRRFRQFRFGLTWDFFN